MAEVNTATFINRYNNATTGLFKNNTTGDIEALDARDLVQYLADSFLNFLDDVLDEDTMASNSATQVPTQQSVKTYADTKWPLGGAADLTASLDLNFEGFDILIHNDFNEVFYQLDYTGHNFYAINDLGDESQFIVSPGTFQGSTTGPINWFSESDLHLHANDGISHMHFELDILVGITLQADDGVDTSSLSLTPTGIIANLDTDGIDFINGLNLTDDTNGYSITSSATRFRILSTGALNSVIDLENDEVRLSSEGQINLDASILTLGQVNAPTIGANTNNYAPDNSTVYRLTSDASRNITGWQPRGTSPIIFVFNAGSFDIVFTHDDTGNSTAANCFLVPGGGSLTLSPGQAVIWIYDLTSTRWRLISYTG